MSEDKRKNTVKIAIDGPSGAGKSTLARRLAQELGYIYVDTGAIYRTVGLYADLSGIDPSDEETLKSRFPDIHIEIKWDSDGKQSMFLNGENVSDRIRTPKISMYASAVSALPAVREFLFKMQRELAEKNSVIMDGRDIGTVILPDAQIKLFMSATPEARAQRRCRELAEKGKNVSYDEVLRDMKIRDGNDSSRSTAPCVPAKDAIMFDNTELDLEGTVDAALSIIKEKLNEIL